MTADRARTAELRRLPDIREVERWNREHRQECVEYHCTLAHRMLEFADWYIVIAHDLNKRLDAAERAERLEAAAEQALDRMQTAWKHLGDGTEQTAQSLWFGIEETEKALSALTPQPETPAAEVEP